MNRLIDKERTRSILAIKILLFSASVIPALVAGALAYDHPQFRWISFILVTAGLFLGQAAGDYFYYYFTGYHSHTGDSHTKIFAGWKPLFIDTLLRPKDSLAAGIICLVLDLLILVWFITWLGAGILWLAAIGAAVALFFTPVMLRGYKEPLIFITFGPLSFFAGYYALTGEFALLPVVVSIPTAFFITVVAYLKGAHYKTKGEGSELVILNINRTHAAVLLVFAYLSIIASVVFGYLAPLALLGLITGLPALLLIRSLRKESTIVHYLKATVYSLLIMILTGVIIAGTILLTD